MGIVVRTPRLGDVDALARVNIDTWRSAYTGLVPRARIEQMDLATYRSRWVDRLSAPRPGVTVLVGELDGRLGAYVVGGPYRPQPDAPPEETAGLGELYAIYVDPPAQGLGVGTAVHDALLGRLAHEGYSEVALWVLVANEPARRWYGRRGWRADGARGTWEAAGEQLPELRMRRTLSGTPLDRPPDQGEWDSDTALL